MKLSAKLICYHLQKSFSMHTSRLDTSPTLSCPSCFEKNTVLQDGRVYLITDPDFQLTFHHPKNILFLMIGKIYQNYELTQPNMCIIPEDIPVNIVFNRIQDIFILYDQWNQSLMDSRLRNASIQELLDLTASIIPNPMMLIGMDFTIIASRDWNLSDLSNSVLGSTENSWAIVDSLKQDPHYEEAFYKTGYFYYPGNGLTAPSLCVNISNNDKAVYKPTETYTCLIACGKEYGEVWHNINANDSMHQINEMDDKIYDFIRDDVEFKKIAEELRQYAHER